MSTRGLTEAFKCCIVVVIYQKYHGMIDEMMEAQLEFERGKE